MKRVGLVLRQWSIPLHATLLPLTTNSATLDICLRHVALHSCTVVYVMSWVGKGQPHGYVMKRVDTAWVVNSRSCHITPIDKYVTLDICLRHVALLCHTVVYVMSWVGKGQTTRLCSCCQLTSLWINSCMNKLSFLYLAISSSNKCKECELLVWRDDHW